MIVKVIFGLRKGYQGQYGPEALDCATEYDYDENPEWLHDKFDLHKKSDDFESLRIVDIEVDDKKLGEILVPEAKLGGKIVA